MAIQFQLQSCSGNQNNKELISRSSCMPLPHFSLYFSVYFLYLGLKLYIMYILLHSCLIIWKLFSFQSFFFLHFLLVYLLFFFSFILTFCSCVYWLICYLWMIEYFQNKLVDTIHFMEILSLKDSVEKDTFFRKLPILAEQLPRQIVLKKVTSKLQYLFSWCAS